MRTEKFTSFDNTILQCYLWNDVKNPKGVVQISHGMAEHARRYDAFAQFLNSNGYIVFADDHRAHGMTSTKQSKNGVYGYHKGDIYNDTVRDEIAAELRRPNGHQARSPRPDDNHVEALFFRLLFHTVAKLEILMRRSTPGSPKSSVSTTRKAPGESPEIF